MVLKCNIKVSATEEKGETDEEKMSCVQEEGHMGERYKKDKGKLIQAAMQQVSKGSPQQARNEDDDNRL